MPRTNQDKQDVRQRMEKYEVQQVMLLNSKFDWKVCDSEVRVLASGKKPAGAVKWAASHH